MNNEIERQEMLAKVIESLRVEILAKVERLYKFVNPTDDELIQLHNDLKQNPEDYTCYLENNRYWIALTILDNRKDAGSCESAGMAG